MSELATGFSFSQSNGSTFIREEGNTIIAKLKREVSQNPANIIEV
jgi:hypothetical protein